MRTLVAIICLVPIVLAQDSPFSRKRPAGVENGEPGEPPARAPKPPRSESANKPASTREAVSKALAYLVSKQRKDGAWESGLAATTGEVVVTSFCALALMASGSSPKGGAYQAQIQRAIEFVAGRVFDPPAMPDKKWDQTNWSVMIGTMFLAEAYSHSPSAEIKAALDRGIVEIFRRMEPSGGWGHYHGGPNPLNYIELEVMSTWALGAAGVLKRLKFRVPSDKVGRAIQFIEDCCAPGSGGVGYSPNRGQKGVGEAGRTGGALWVFGLHGLQGHSLYPLMANWFRRNLSGSTNCHGSIALGCLSAALGARQLGGQDWDAFVAAVFPKVLGQQQGDGSFSPIRGTGAGAAGGDDSAGPNYNTGLYALVLQLDLGHLNHLGVKF